jgi:hypothetical protein
VYKVERKSREEKKKKKKKKEKKVNRIVIATTYRSDMPLSRYQQSYQVLSAPHEPVTPEVTARPFSIPTGNVCLQTATLPSITL